MASLNDDQILNLLNDGYASDFDIPSDDEPENELELLLHNFENVDLRGFLGTQAQRLSAEVNISMEVENKDEMDFKYVEAANENLTDVVTPIALGFRYVQKKKKLNG